MLKLIIQLSALLLNFLLSLCLSLSKPQQMHVLRTVEALIVTDGRKILANLYRQWVAAPDEKAVLFIALLESPARYGVPLLG